MEYTSYFRGTSSVMKGVLFNVWNRNIGDRKLADS